jgi:aminoglycoside 2'-N-acetyltransferase I
VAHTADVTTETLDAAHALLRDVFDDLVEDDWEHALGGIHALAYDGAELVGHASLIQRRLMYRGRALRTGYVEGVAVRSSHRRRGVGAALMTPLERIVRGAYDLGALGSTDEAVPFYLGRGWQLWTGATAALTPDGVRPTPDADAAVYVLPCGLDLDLGEQLICDWRDGDVW